MLSIFAPGLSRKLKTKFSAWENPEDSIGDWLCDLGKDNCWEAQGPAREAFVQLGRKITAYLERCSDPVPEPHTLTLSVYMIGRSKETAVPVILFVCGDKESRHKARNAIEDARILDQSGIRTAEGGWDPGSCKPIQPLADMRLEDFLLSTPEEKGTVLSLESAIIFGRPVFVGPISLRKATTGAVLCSGDRYFYLLPAHVFDNGQEVPPARTVDDTNSDYEIDSLYNSGDDDVDCTSRGNPTRLHGGLEKESSEHYTHVSNEPSYTGATGPDAIAVPITVTPEGCDDSEAAAASSPPETNLSIPPRHSLPTSEPLKKIGKLLWLEKDLDYAIVEITDLSLLMKLRTLQPGDSELQTLYPKRVSSSAPKDVGIKTVTGSSGLLRGEMLGTPAYLRLPGSRVFNEVWKVRLHGNLAVGDSGSCIIDSTTNELYGYIVAGSPGAGVGYIIPAHTVFSHIETEWRGHFDYVPYLLSLEEYPYNTSADVPGQVRDGPLDVGESRSPINPAFSHGRGYSSLTLPENWTIRPAYFERPDSPTSSEDSILQPPTNVEDYYAQEHQGSSQWEQGWQQQEQDRPQSAHEQEYRFHAGPIPLRAGYIWHCCTCGWGPYPGWITTCFNCPEQHQLCDECLVENISLR